ncbi:MAG: arginine--tRNA ligase [Actinomycetota bacterium]|nr:arginine--tRNA ligase [Actinomycetota bacterium]
MPAADPVARLAAELSEAVGAPIELERPSDPAHGDYATNAALQLAPERRLPPRELAEEIAASASRVPAVERAEIAGPGFVNLWLTDAWLADALASVVERGRDFGAGEPERRERVQVEMVSANPTGPITVASGRNGAYGDSVARLLDFAGHQVEREYYYNDSGAQMEKFRASVEARRRGEEPPEDGYRGAYIDELAASDEDPVPRTLEEIERTLDVFRVHFDSWALQSRLESRLAEFLPRLDTYEKDGALWARSSKYGDDDDRVLIRSAEQGGGATYRAADVVYLADKLERGFDRAIYVLGADHYGTRNWYAAVARMLGYDPERIEVLIYQLVHLTSGGQQRKMSKRRGDVVFLDDFMDEVGVDAARWYLVNRGPDQTIEIDVDLAAERSQKNPVYYVQYAHARIAGILRNATGEPISAQPSQPLEPEERELIKRLLEFPVVVADATERRAPQAIPVYAIRVADDFHRFYHEQRVLGSDAEACRLALIRAAQNVIARSLDLVGVEAPERM